jgi:hypothetical protein
VRCQRRHVTTETRSPPPTSVYLVERYLSARDTADLAAAVTRLTRACRATVGSHMPVRYLHSTVVAGDDTCFCLFQAGSSDAVMAVNVAARFGFDRISNAELIRPTDDGSGR